TAAGRGRRGRGGRWARGAGRGGADGGAGPGDAGSRRPDPGVRRAGSGGRRRAHRGVVGRYGGRHPRRGPPRHPHVQRHGRARAPGAGGGGGGAGPARAALRAHRRRPPRAPGGDGRSRPGQGPDRRRADQRRGAGRRAARGRRRPRRPDGAALLRRRAAGRRPAGGQRPHPRRRPAELRRRHRLGLARPGPGGGRQRRRRPRPVDQGPPGSRPRRRPRPAGRRRRRRRRPHGGGGPDRPPLGLTLRRSVVASRCPAAGSPAAGDGFRGAKGGRARSVQAGWQVAGPPPPGTGQRYSPGAAVFGGDEGAVGDAGVVGAAGFVGDAGVVGAVGPAEAPPPLGWQSEGPPPSGIEQVNEPPAGADPSGGTGPVQVESPPPAGTWQWRGRASRAKPTAGSGSPTGRHSAAPDPATTQLRAGVTVTPSAAEQRIGPPAMTPLTEVWAALRSHCMGTGWPVRSASWVKGSEPRWISIAPAPARALMTRTGPPGGPPEWALPFRLTPVWRLPNSSNVPAPTEAVARTSASQGTVTSILPAPMEMWTGVSPAGSWSRDRSSSNRPAAWR